MALRSPEGFDADRLRNQVLATYQQVAQQPDGAFHFHRGPRYAVDYLGYDPDELAALPALATDRFAGVGNPLALAPIPEGAVVLDHACGAGTDLLLAVRRAGARGRGIGVDLTPAMRTVARRAAHEAGLADRVTILEGRMEALPLEDASVDVVISNGVVNLSTDKPAVFSEIARVLRPGGRLLLADVAVAREVKVEARQDPDLWAACIGGALQEHELVELARLAGLQEPKLAERFDCFRGTSAEAHVAKDLNVHGVTFTALRA